MTELYIKDKIAFITLKNPPVNSLSLHVRNELVANIESAAFDTKVKAIIIKGNGKTFCAGADIKEFKTGLVFENFIAFVINDVELCGKPVFALIHGNAFGGGFELALGCHFRIASSKSTVGLPEVTLGILPGAGGTQRLPRLIGFWHAVEMICSGKLIKAADAYSKGAIDLVINVPAEVSGEDEIAFMEEKAIEFVQQHWDDDLTSRIEANKEMEGLNDFFYSQIEDKLKKGSRGMIAPLKSFEILKSSVGKPFKKGMDMELQALGELTRSSQAAALQHVFFSERNATKLLLPKNLKPMPVRKAGVIGAGLMGCGITINFIKAGLPLTLIEQKEEYLKKGLKTITSILMKGVKKGKTTKEKVNKMMSLIKTSTSYDDLADADVVIEAVFENMEVKKSVMSRLDKACKPSAILCTNTSTLDVDEIASSTSRPEKVIGMHFFAPANVMKLLENVKGEKTSPETILTITKLSKKLRKTPVLVGNCFGFVANRMLLAYMNQAFTIALHGSTPKKVDRVMRSFGLPMGPFQVADLSGIDIVCHIKNSAKAALERGLKGSAGGKTSESAPFHLAEKLFGMKRLGAKTGRGFYIYDKSKKGRRGIEDGEVIDMLKESAKSLGVERREFTNEEIIDRCLMATINEGFKCLEDGSASRPSDIDIVWIFGFGFPPYRGGPMFHADALGLENVFNRIQKYQKTEPENPYWETCELLKKLASSGESAGRYFAVKQKKAMSKL